MGNIFNNDFRDFISTLNDFDVKYLLVGGYSVILHGHSRSTGDMDIWVERTEKNYQKLKLAFFEFGMPVFDMTKDNFLNHPEWDVFTFGKPPSSIDLMVRLKGLEFNSAYDNAVTFNEEGLLIKTIHINDLLIAKKAASRAKDVDDIDNLSKLDI